MPKPYGGDSARGDVLQGMRAPGEVWRAPPEGSPRHALAGVCFLMNGIVLGLLPCPQIIVYSALTVQDSKSCRSDLVQQNTCDLRHLGHVIDPSVDRSVDWSVG